VTGAIPHHMSILEIVNPRTRLSAHTMSLSREYNVTLRRASQRTIAAVQARVALHAVPNTFRTYLDQVYAAARAGAVQLDGQNVFVYQNVPDRPTEVDLAFGVGVRAPFVTVGKADRRLLFARTGRFRMNAHPIWRPMHVCYRISIATALLWRAQTSMAQTSMAQTSMVQANTAESVPSPDSIRRLAPASFPKLPRAIRHDLERRGCLIPQPYSEHAPANVVHGSFTAAKVSEWAILCSVRHLSQILIYRSLTNRNAVVRDSLLRSADVAWMQGVGGNQRGYSRMIRRLPLEQIRGWRQDADGHAVPQPIDHDAIEQTFIEKSAEGFYYVAGRLYRQLTAD
jgi:hypothetical protein